MRFWKNALQNEFQPDVFQVVIKIHDQDQVRQWNEPL